MLRTVFRFSDGWGHYLLLAACLVATGGTVASAASVSAPYSDDFSTSNGGAAANFVISGSSWSVTGGAYVGSLVPGLTSNSAISVNNLGANQNFVLTSTLVPTYNASDNNSGTTIKRFGFGALSSSSDLTNTNSSIKFYLADISSTGLIRLLDLNDTGYTAGTTNNAASALTSGATYTLQLSGTYVGTSLQLNFYVMDSTGTTIASASGVDITPLVGTWFGYRDYDPSGNTASASWDNFSIVPEPGGLAFIAMGWVGMLRRRKANIALR